MEKTYNELVRDKLVNKLVKERDVLEIKYHTAKDSEELNKVIADKLVATANQLRDRLNDTGKIDIDDIVEVQEILDKIKHEATYNSVEYSARQEELMIEKGMYDLNVVLDKVVRRD